MGRSGFPAGTTTSEAEDGAIEHGFGHADDAKLLLGDAGDLLERLAHARQALCVVLARRIDEQHAAARVGDSADKGDVSLLPRIPLYAQCVCGIGHTGTSHHRKRLFETTVWLDETAVKRAYKVITLSLYYQYPVKTRASVDFLYIVAGIARHIDAQESPTHCFG